MIMGSSRILETFLPFTPTLTNFASRQAKESGPTEKFLEKYRFCPKTAHSVVQKGKRKMQVFEIKHLHFVWYPEPGSNRHGLLHWCLRPARLPIPPSGPMVARVSLLEGGRPSG